MNQEALNKLKDIITRQAAQEAVGRPARAYISENLHDVDAAVLQVLPEQKLDRKTLRKYCLPENHSTEACYLAVMCWGGIRANHLRSAWSLKNHWMPALDAVRRENMSRGEHFDLFKKLMDKNLLKGMRAPFFTKLLYFMRLEDNAYIMDQWVSKSVNLLMNKSVVPMNKNQVHKGASAHDFDTFCLALEAIADEIGKLPQETEEVLFSKGGKNPGEWRQYVKAHYPPFR